MISINDKLSVLRKIAVQFEKEKITWALGASALLYFRGVVSSFNDLDLIVDANDIDKAKILLGNLGTLQAKIPPDNYRTRHFYQYIIEGVDIDLISDFIIVSNGKEYHFPLQKEHISSYRDVNGTTLRLHSLEEWRKYYHLMGRKNKVALIDEFFSTIRVQ